MNNKKFHIIIRDNIFCAFSFFIWVHDGKCESEGLPSPACTLSHWHIYEPFKVLHLFFHLDVPTPIYLHGSAVAIPVAYGWKHLFSHLAVQFFYWDWGALLFSVLEVFLVFAALLIWAGSFICYSPWFLRKSSSLMLGWKENISIHILLFPNDLFPLQLNIQSLLNVSSSVYLFYRGKDTCLA